MEKHDIDWKQIGRLEVGTESMVDRSKSIKTFLMRHFEASGNHDVEGVDTYNACYGGTAALLNSIGWLKNRPPGDNRLALVIAVDIADLREEQQFLNGAAAVAILLGPDAPLVLDSARGSHM